MLISQLGRFVVDVTVGFSIFGGTLGVIRIVKVSFCMRVEHMFQWFSALIALFFSPFLIGQTELAIPEGVLINSGIDVGFVARFALFVSMLLLWTVGWGKLLHKLLRLPTIAGQIIGGILIGPSFLDIKQMGIFSDPLRLYDHATGSLYALASSDLFVFVVLLISSALTVSYLLWIAGHETDIGDILKVGVTATSAGLLGAIIPVLMTAAAMYYGNFTLLEGVGVGLIFAATSVSIPVAMLFSHNKMHLKSSKATLGAAIIDDIFAVILLSVFFIAVQSGLFGCVKEVHCGHTASIVEAVVYMMVSFVVIFFTGYFVIPPIFQWMRKKQRSHLIAPVANGIMLIYFAFAELVGGLAGITGAYFAGLFHRMGDGKHVAVKAISPYVNAVLLPLFLGSIGLQLNLRVLSLHDWFTITWLFILAVASKLLSCYIATWLSNLSGRRGSHTWSLNETFLFGSSMVARGEVGLVIATILRGSDIISSQVYVVSVVVIVLTTIVTPVMLAIGFAYHKEQEDEQEYLLNVGFFNNVGTAQMFNIIVGAIGARRGHNTTIRFSRGRRVFNLEQENVKIILSPSKGVFFEGNQAKIREIIDMVKKTVQDDLEGLSAR